MKIEASTSGGMVLPGKEKGFNGLAMAAILLLLAAAAYFGYTRLYHPAAPVAKPQTATVTKGTVAAAVIATGSVASSATSRLAFKSPGNGTGILNQLLVSVGDHVKQGQLLAKLEDGDLRAQVAQAEAQLASAKAKLDGMKVGARPEDVANATAALAAARAKLSLVQKGPTQADLQAAEAAVVTARSNLVSAEAKLNDLRQGPTAEDLTIAQTAVDQAKASLATAQAKLDELKAGPTQTDIATAQAVVNSAKQALTTAEDKYEMAKGVDSNGNSTLAASGFSSVSAAQQNYETAKANYDTAVQKANDVMAGATAAELQAAQSAVDTAKASLAGAEAKLAQVKAGQTQAELVQAEQSVDSARSAVASAEAKLDLLKAEATPEDVEMAQASVSQAESLLALKSSPYTESDIQAAQAAVDQAAAAVTIAKLNLDNASLLAPFDGVVAAVSAAVGEPSSGTVLTLVDPKQVRVDVSLAETDVARVKLGQDVQLSFEALPGPRFSGKVVAIAPAATVQSGVSTYLVSISIGDLIRQQQGASGQGTGTPPAGAIPGSGVPPSGMIPGSGMGRGASGGTTASSGAAPAWTPGTTVARDGATLQDQPKEVQDLFVSSYGDEAGRVWAAQRSRELEIQNLKPGMTATATIVYAQKADVLTVPNRAIKMQGQNRVVDVLVNGAVETRVVQVGLSSDQVTEIAGGLSEGDQVVIQTTGTAAVNVPGLTGGSTGVPGAGGGMGSGQPH